MKTVLIKQKAGLGDILFCQKIGQIYQQRGHPVIWPVAHTYNYITEYLPQMQFADVTTDFPFKTEYDCCG
ncbi:hypothetical protein EBR43_12675, partial [bacterium]|nr:hypothetical protein [bacterium]